jgi:hypothetical protein
MIKGTVYAQRLSLYKTKRHLSVRDDDLLGQRWYTSFMERNKDKIRRGAGKIRDIKRHTWCTYDAFSEMYNCVHGAMEEAGVCRKLDSPLMLGFDGTEVLEEKETFGRPTQYMVDHPEMVIFVDETGSNTSQNVDGKNGGRRYILPKDGSAGSELLSVTDMHFTVLPFIAGTGEPVLCAIILKSEKPIEQVPYNWRYGFDITKQVLTGEEIDLFMLNTGDGMAMQGGPTCFFQGKEIPCFVCTSPKASITSSLLADMLKYLDSFNLFDRSSGKRPLLLLDVHHSRMDLPFLDYIHGAGHNWVCFIGVPYATHIWPVADSPQLNGSFKIALTKKKQRFFE